MFFSLVVVLACCFAVTLHCDAANTHDLTFYRAKFDAWFKFYSKSLGSKSTIQLENMLQNFANNDDIIALHNAGNHTFTLGHNQFSHLSPDEWKSYLKFDKKRQEKMMESTLKIPLPTPLKSNPSAIDWRASGSVSSVKDQGACGSCWAFSSVGALEGAYKIKYGTLVGFSAQWFVDCDSTNEGCEGGLMDSAFTYAQTAGGLCAESEYPYTATEGVCQKCTAVKNSAPKGYYDVRANNDEALVDALVVQPVSVAVDASSSAFQLYKYGIFGGRTPCGDDVNHAVLVVGYGVDPSFGEHYWDVKNSWGTDWGENGYMRLTRNVPPTQKSGACGVLSMPSAPTY